MRAPLLLAALLTGCATVKQRPEPNGVSWLPARVASQAMKGGLAIGGMQGGGGTVANSDVLGYLDIDADEYFRITNTSLLLGADEVVCVVDTNCTSYFGSNDTQDALVFVAGAGLAGGLRFSGATLFQSATTFSSSSTYSASSGDALVVAAGAYARLSKTSAGAPDAGDCNDDAERGRIAIDTSNNRLYLCNGASRGWDYVALTD